MKKFWYLIFGLILLPSTALAQFPILPAPRGDTYELIDVLILIGNLVQIVFALAGAIAVIYLIIGGYGYMTSFGNPEKAEMAKLKITWAVVGFIIAVLAFIAIRFAWGLFGGDLPAPPA